jgi:hypothetical protein
VKSPRAAIQVLVAQLADAVVVDDLGRQCVTRDTARGLFAEQAEAERRWREEQEHHHAELAELAEQNRPAVGIPIPEGLEDVDAGDRAEAPRAPGRGRAEGCAPASTLDEMFTGVMEYHPISDREES